MQFQLADSDTTGDVVTLLAACNARLQEVGIHQWDALYPTPELIAADAAARRLWLARQDGVTIGAITLDTHAPASYARVDWAVPADTPALLIHRLCLAPSHQGLGLSRALLELAEAQARRLSLTVLRTDVHSGNPAAQATFARQGYQRRGELFFPRRSAPFVCLEKLLTD
ncbi:GNAT family N-acetyltransferase [Neisseriaceae bacterium JH1-16]|nr:GNAT family N-acetyltransferase [Neisseriaceae bacterium JH1-16]